jgi:hypothetical protein
VQRHLGGSGSGSWILVHRCVSIFCRFDQYRCGDTAQEKGPVLRAGSERGWVGGASPGDEVLYAPGRPLCFREEEAKAAQQADIAMTIKVQVTLDAGLFPL